MSSSNRHNLGLFWPVERNRLKTNDFQRLPQFFHRRWTVPILAELSVRRGCKFAWLVHTLGAGRAVVRQTLDDLIDLGLVQRNAGYGHPLRPEYLLTDRGRAVAPACAALMGALRAADVLDVGLKKWSMPTLAAVGSGADRFGAIARRLGGATDRAVSLALKDLRAVRLIDRRVDAGAPPAPIYATTTRGLALAARLDVLTGTP